MRIISSLDDYLIHEEWDGKFELIQCKRALSPSKLPDLDFALNPYGGCSHGCVYCYAPEVTHAEWGGWRIVKVKTNIVDRLAQEMKYVRGTIGVGTVTDPYQTAEKRFELTHDCLEAIRRFGNKIHINTKSDLILRDIDLISSMDSIVGITVTSVNDRYSKMTEPGASLPDDRLRALKEFADAGVDTYALVGPTLSHIEGDEERLVDRIADTGVSYIYIDRLNSRPLLNARLQRMGLKGASDLTISRIKTLAKSRGLDVKNVF